MGKVLKISNKQVKILKEFEDNFIPKIKITEDQYKRLIESNDENSTSGKLTKSFNKEFKRSNLNIQAESNSLEHPIQGNGDDYTPQTIKQNKETTASFNEGLKRPSVTIFGKNLVEYLRNTLKGGKEYPKFFKEYGIPRKRLKKALRLEKVVRDCMIGEERSIKLNKDIGNSVKRMYERFFPMDLELNESNYPVGISNDSNAPFNQDTKTTTPFQPEIKFKELFTDAGTAIFTDGKNYFYFDFQELNVDDFEDYVERSYKIVGRDEDGDSEIEYDNNYEIDGDVIERYVNSDLQALNSGKGVSKEITGVNYMHDGDYDFILLDDEGKKEFMSWFKNDSKNLDYLKKIFNLELEETTTAGASSGQFTASMGGQSKPIDYNRSPEEEMKIHEVISNDETLNFSYGSFGDMTYETDGNVEKINGEYVLKLKEDGKVVKTDIKFEKDGNLLKIGFRKDGTNSEDVSKIATTETIKKLIEFGKNIQTELEETTTAGASSGQYSTPKIWAKNKDNHILNKKPIYPKGEIVETDLKKDTSYPKGEFVEFDDCVKIGKNDKTAIEGGCSQGAIDNVVKTKKSKSSIISKEALYYETAKKMGKKVEEVRKIIEKNRIK